MLELLRIALRVASASLVDGCLVGRKGSEVGTATIARFYRGCQKTEVPGVEATRDPGASLGGTQ